MATKQIDRESLEARIALGKRIREAREVAGISGRALARRLGVSHSFISQVENGQSGMTSENMARLSSILGVSFAEWISLVTGGVKRSRIIEPEGEKIDLKTLAFGDARFLRDAMDGKKGEVWLLKSEHIAGKYHPGDCLIVDVTAAAKAGDFVLAEFEGVPVFRLYFPPYLFTLPISGPAPSSVRVDMTTVVIKGVVTRAIKF
jgi:transcriptional regulator with XRE-family HTH domain